MNMPYRLALPLADGVFCPHFGRASQFMLCDVERDSWVPGRTRTIVKRLRPGECESVPDWLKSMMVTTVLAGGIGPVAQERLKALGISLVMGLSGDDPLRVLGDWLDHRQSGGPNACMQGAHLLRHCRTKRSTS